MVKKILPPGAFRRRHLSVESSKRALPASSSNESKIKLRKRSLVSTQVKKKFSVPISVADIHLRNEQLPFAYFFDARLDPSELQDSFSKVLKYFPTAGGKLINYQQIRCSPSDFVPISFVDAEMTMQEWLSVNRGHLHQSGNGSHPSLLPIFDPLFHSDLTCTKAQNDSGQPEAFENLLTARITQFANNSGTVVALNANHMLGDTASCVRLAECWGLAHQRRQFGVPCLDRSALSSTGMMNPTMVDLMENELANDQEKGQENLTSWLDLFSRDDEVEKTEKTLTIDHEYISLPFSVEVLDAMKAHGMRSCETSNNKKECINPPYISKNDMIMASAWFLKHHLSSDDNTSCLSIVMNLRGRCGLKNFKGDGDRTNLRNGMKQKNGLFGNGIMNVFADEPTMGSNRVDVLSKVSRASKAIRLALIQGENEIPLRIAQSKMGAPSSSSTKPTSSTSSYFSSTSWRQLSPENVSFSPSSNLVSFHGQPAHPIPEGRTYASGKHASITCAYYCIIFQIEIGMCQ